MMKIRTDSQHSSLTLYLLFPVYCVTVSGSASGHRSVTTRGLGRAFIHLLDPLWGLARWYV